MQDVRCEGNRGATDRCASVRCAVESEGGLDGRTVGHMLLQKGCPGETCREAAKAGQASGCGPLLNRS